MTARKDPPNLWLSPAEEAQLMRLVYEAYELRESPYLRDACEAIAKFWEDTRPDRHERKAKAAPSLNRDELQRRLRR